MHDTEFPGLFRSLGVSAVLLVGWSGAVAAQSDGAQPAAAGAAPVVCASTGARQHCDADTSSGVVLVKSTGAAECLLGKTWGYDNTGIWVADGCAGEFLAGAAAASAAIPADAPPRAPTDAPAAADPRSREGRRNLER